MHRCFPAIRIFCAFTAWLCCGHAWAAKSGSEVAPAQFSAEVGIGGEYDSNVTVDEVDLASGRSDYALILDAGVEASKALSQKFDISGTYDVSQTLYDEFSSVDRQTHILGTDMTMDFDVVEPGIAFFYIHSLLDNDKFLDLYRVAPSVSGFLARKWFARGAYVYFSKSINNQPERDASANAGEADVYYFLHGLRNYFNLGYRYRVEDANSDQYSYASNAVKLRYIQRIELFSRMAKFELSWRYEDRSYTSETLSIGEDRDDRRQFWRADVEIPVSGSSALQFYAGYSDYGSNYPPADYTQKVAGTRFVYRW
jgi:hypothetical protein